METWGFGGKKDLQIECGMVMDRDTNAAKNIHLKNMQVLGFQFLLPSPTLGPPLQSSDCCPEAEMLLLGYYDWKEFEIWEAELLNLCK